MKKKRCPYCECYFLPEAHNRRPCYRDECIQAHKKWIQARKNQWKRENREKQRQYQEKFLSENPGYSAQKQREFRKRRPGYAPQSLPSWAHPHDKIPNGRICQMPRCNNPLLGANRMYCYACWDKIEKWQIRFQSTPPHGGRRQRSNLLGLMTKLGALCGPRFSTPPFFYFCIYTSASY